MNRESILQEIRAHRGADAREEGMRLRIEAFISAHERFHDRGLALGHVTGSAWILDRDRRYALLTHHRKLDVWVQLGGHVEADLDILSAAWREAREESGLTDVSPISTKIFDVDVHRIPAGKYEPEHFHYDIRYLFFADRNSDLTISPESKTLAWVSLDRISELTQEESILRMIHKSPLV